MDGLEAQGVVCRNRLDRHLLQLHILELLTIHHRHQENVNVA